MGKNLTSIPGTSGPSHPLQSTIQPILGVLEQFWPKNLAEQANPTASLTAYGSRWQEIDPVVSYNGEISSVGHPSPLRRELGRIATGYSRALSDYHFVYALHRHFALDVVVQGPNAAP